MIHGHWQMLRESDVWFGWKCGNGYEGNYSFLDAVWFTLEWSSGVLIHNYTCWAQNDGGNNHKHINPRAHTHLFVHKMFSQTSIHFYNDSYALFVHNNAQSVRIAEISLPAWERLPHKNARIVWLLHYSIYALRSMHSMHCVVSHPKFPFLCLRSKPS